LVGFENIKAELAEQGIKVIAASIDDEEKAGEVAADVSFPVAHGVTKAQADAIGAWWEDRRGIIQPSELLIDSEGKICVSSYSDGPLGRMDAGDVVKLVAFYESRKNQ
jgi:peroxiredoxin